MGCSPAATEASAGKQAAPVADARMHSQRYGVNKVSGS